MILGNWRKIPGEGFALRKKALCVCKTLSSEWPTCPKPMPRQGSGRGCPRCEQDYTFPVHGIRLSLKPRQNFPLRGGGTSTWRFLRQLWAAVPSLPGAGALGVCPPGIRIERWDIPASLGWAPTGDYKCSVWCSGWQFCKSGSSERKEPVKQVYKSFLFSFRHSIDFSLK